MSDLSFVTDAIERLTPLVGTNEGWRVVYGKTGERYHCTIEWRRPTEGGVAQWQDIAKAWWVVKDEQIVFHYWRVEDYAPYVAVKRLKGMLEQGSVA